jgi:Arc/MetJ family transcription regulator
MRTNIVINDELITQAMRLTGLRTKREVVEEALRVLGRNASQAAVLDLEGTVHWEGDLQSDPAFARRS